ncbi:hypothetical protein [Thermobispora bispora]|uniref:hypothetical protein n=1 Tax=Thermobispora bispora TaxID=2006 RepID=UPI00197DDD1E|nr:hypothetical protein [Thermobispora bispora]QSI49979.1 hypothetical protein CYL17_18560 [Thermobispora bispora]
MNIPALTSIEDLELIPDVVKITYRLPNGPTIVDGEERRWAIRKLDITYGRERHTWWEVTGYLVKRDGSVSEHRTRDFNRYHGLSAQLVARFDRIVNAILPEWAAPCSD